MFQLTCLLHLVQSTGPKIKYLPSGLALNIVTANVNTIVFIELGMAINI